MSNVAAGWYPAPVYSGKPMLEYWDGQRWTGEQREVPVSAPLGWWVPSGLKNRVRELELSVAQMQDLLAKGNAAELGNSVVRLEELQKELADKAAELDAIKKAVDFERGVLFFAEVGVNDFAHPAQDSASLAAELEVLRSDYKEMIRSKKAIRAASSFTFNGSAAQGKKFISQLSKVMLRAYNNEVENAVKSVTHRNLNTVIGRVNRFKEQVAQAGSMIDLEITEAYHRLRIREIVLAHQHNVALAEEKALERERRAELREQAKVEAELRRAQEKLKKEQAHYQTTLAALQAKGDSEGVARMEAKLADVQKALEDVNYRSANIRAGYVYVISNEGSFGKGVVKIGLTRRLDPMDRVRELGDASVPFNFNVHALFFADDAVEIEAKLHKHFERQRINLINIRREFFRVTPEEVLQALKDINVEIVEFAVDVEAKEYIDSEYIREQNSMSLTA